MNTGEIYKIENLFEEDTRDFLMQSFNTKRSNIQEEYGRRRVFGVEATKETISKIEEIVKNLFGISLSGYLSLSVEYSNKYGKPNLPPHFDGDDTDIILNYQLHSNTSWNVGVNTGVIQMENNSAVIFNPNTNIHWRPKKEFKDGEFVRMIFFRFMNKENTSDYSHIRYSLNDPIFDDVHAFRNSL